METFAQRPDALRDAMAKVGRNDPCPCGSGNKYKRCCVLALAPTTPVAPVLSTADPIVDDGHCDCCIDRLTDEADRAFDLLLDGDLTRAPFAPAARG